MHLKPNRFQPKLNSNLFA
jgi:carbonyl reductase 1